HLRPRTVHERLAGGGDGEVDVFLLPGGRGGVVRVGDGVQYIEGLAADGVNELAVDEVLDVGGQVLRDIVGGGFWCHERHCCLPYCCGGWVRCFLPGPGTR